jgi:hypothetical protein
MIGKLIRNMAQDKRTAFPTEFQIQNTPSFLIISRLLYVFILIGIPFQFPAIQFLSHFSSVESRSTGVTQSQIPQVPVVLNSRHLRVMIVGSAICSSMRGSGDSIAKQDREDLIVAGVALRFIESWICQYNSQSIIV